MREIAEEADRLKGTEKKYDNCTAELNLLKETPSITTGTGSLVGIALGCVALGLVLGVFFVNCYRNMQSHPDEDDTEESEGSDEESGLKQNTLSKDNDPET